MYQSPRELEFTVRSVSGRRTTRSGNVYVECTTDVGIVAFWGTEARQENVDRILSAAVPARVTCRVIDSNWSHHRYWIPERAAVVLHVDHQSADEAERVVSQPSTHTADAEILNKWRRQTLRLLERVSGDLTSDEGPVSRITALKKRGDIPRPIAALLIGVLEIRNAYEHEGKAPTESEWRSAEAAWEAVADWARSMEVDVDEL